MDVTAAIAFHKAQLAIHEANEQAELVEWTRDQLVQLSHVQRVNEQHSIAEKAYIAALPLAEVI